MNDLLLRQQLRALRVERLPERDLWDGIAPQLTAPRRRPTWLPFALAASVLLALPSALLLRPAPPGPSTDTYGMTREADAMALQYRAALAELSAAPLPDSLRGVADQLERDAEQLRDALESQPRSIELLHQLRRTYDQRLRLNQRVLLG